MMTLMLVGVFVAMPNLVSSDGNAHQPREWRVREQVIK
jgi:hypothetical protein